MVGNTEFTGNTERFFYHREHRVYREHGEIFFYHREQR